MTNLMLEKQGLVFNIVLHFQGGEHFICDELMKLHLYKHAGGSTVDQHLEPLGLRSTAG